MRKARSALPACRQTLPGSHSAARCSPWLTAYRTSSTRVEMPSLLKMRNQIFLHRVFAETEFLSNLPVRKSLGYQGNNLLFTRSNEGVSVCVHHAQGRDLRHQIN